MALRCNAGQSTDMRRVAKRRVATRSEAKRGCAARCHRLHREGLPVVRSDLDRGSGAMALRCRAQRRGVMRSVAGRRNAERSVARQGNALA